MELSDKTFAHQAAKIQSLGGVIAGAAPVTASAASDERATRLALRWFAQMRAGSIDRAQLTADYNAQLTDDAVQQMSRFLTAYQYGASPTGAYVLKTRSVEGQTFHAVKLVFPRGDAASLMFGLDAAGKITGVSLLSMAGD